MKEEEEEKLINSVVMCLSSRVSLLVFKNFNKENLIAIAFLFTYVHARHIQIDQYSEELRMKEI